MRRDHLRDHIGRQILRRGPSAWPAAAGPIAIGLKLRNDGGLLIAQRLEADQVEPVRPAHIDARAGDADRLVEQATVSCATFSLSALVVTSR
jgi:hypothetical protein